LSVVILQLIHVCSIINIHMQKKQQKKQQQQKQQQQHQQQQQP
jgi:hypothetical protein